MSLIFVYGVLFMFEMFMLEMLVSSSNLDSSFYYHDGNSYMVVPVLISF